MSQEPLYTVRDGAGATYGPASLAVLRQWITEGRITAHMEIAPQGTENFRPAGQIAELESAFSALSAPAATGAAVPASASGTAIYNPGAPLPMAYGKSSGLAIASLICSLCGPLFCAMPAIVGIILGHIARGQIRREPERYDGMGLATAGLIIGYCMVGLVALAILAYVVIIAVAISTGSMR